MDASNASVYDGATAAAESLIMMRDAKRKKKILYSAGLHPEVKATINTYARFIKLELVEIPLDETGVVDRAALEANASDADILKAVLAEPALIERPIIETDKGARIGRPVERVLEVL